MPNLEYINVPGSPFDTGRECVFSAGVHLVQAIEYNKKDENCRVVPHRPLTVVYGEGIGKNDQREALCYIIQREGL